MLTLDRLKRKEWSLVNRCFYCKEEEESIDHILLHYARAKIIWNLVFSLFRIT